MRKPLLHHLLPSQSPVKCRINVHYDTHTQTHTLTDVWILLFTHASESCLHLSLPLCVLNVSLMSQLVSYVYEV